MATKVHAKKKTPTTKAKAPAPEKPVKKERPAPVTAMTEKDEDSVAARVVAALTLKETPKEREERFGATRRTSTEAFCKRIYAVFASTKGAESHKWGSGGD